MKLISKLSMLVVMMAMFAFTAIESSIVGKYGEKESTKMEISFLESGDFVYTDNSNAESPLKVEGKWTANDKNVITLTDFGSAEIPTQWKFDEKNKAVKARQGMTFYRLADTAKKSCCASKGEGKSCSDKK